MPQAQLTDSKIEVIYMTRSRSQKSKKQQILFTTPLTCTPFHEGIESIEPLITAGALTLSSPDKTSIKKMISGLICKIQTKK